MEERPPFTAEQVAVLSVVGRFIGVLYDGLLQLRKEFNAVHRILDSRGLITRAEWDSALAEVEREWSAAEAVESALDPEIQVLMDYIRRLKDEGRA